MSPIHAFVFRLFIRSISSLNDDRPCCWRRQASFGSLRCEVRDARENRPRSARRSLMYAYNRAGFRPDWPSAEAALLKLSSK